MSFYKKNIRTESAWLQRQNGMQQPGVVLELFAGELAVVQQAADESAEGEASLRVLRERRKNVHLYCFGVRRAEV